MSLYLSLKSINHFIRNNLVPNTERERIRNVRKERHNQYSGKVTQHNYVTQDPEFVQVEQEDGYLFFGYMMRKIPR